MRVGMTSMFQRVFGDDNVAIVMAKVAAAIVFVSLLSVNWLSHTVATYEADKERLSKLAGSVSRQKTDPTTTGALSRRIEALQLDPCSTARRN